MALMGLGANEVKAIGPGIGLVRRLAGLGRMMLDQLYPPGCIVCQAPLALGDCLCPTCFAGLAQISQPYCPVLGIPFAVDHGADALSAEALAEPPPFARARAAVRYGEVAGALVSALKYGDRPELAGFCARLMAAVGRDFWPSSPLLVPVPLHASRLRRRRYNQSVLLARELARLTGLEVDPHLVRRQRNTRQQVGLSGDGRERNVRGAFAAHPRLAERLRGRPVVLVDDVYTTGATVKAVTRVLRRAGAAEVNVLTFARVVIGEDSPI
jgi:Predicted amidophosphoribosyltransferases